MDVKKLNIQLNFCIRCEPTKEAIKKAVEKQCTVVGDVLYAVDDNNNVIDDLIPINHFYLPMTVTDYKRRAMNDCMSCPPDFEYSIKDCKAVFGQDTITIDDWILYTMVCHALCDMLNHYDVYKDLLYTHNDTELKRIIKYHMLEECNGKV